MNAPVRKRDRESALYVYYHGDTRDVPATRMRCLREDGWTGGWPQNELCERIAQAIASARAQEQDACARYLDRYSSG